MRYILGYFALMLGLGGLSLLAAGQAQGFLFLLVSAALVYLIVRNERARRRARRYGEYAEAIEGYEKRFSDAERSLEEKLPQDALDSPALVELLSAYEHEGTDESDAIRAEYERLRKRFLEWRGDFERLHAENEAGAIGLPASFAEQYDKLDRQLSELLTDVEHLEARGAEAGREADNPLDEIARAALKLEQTKSTCQRVFGNAVPAELESQLALGDEKLAQARGALAKGAERPIAAARLAREVCDLTAAVAQRADQLVKLPAQLGAERAQVNGDCDRLQSEIADAKAKLESAAEIYAPSCLFPIRGFGAAAEQALGHARTLLATQSGSAGGSQLDQAKESVARTADLVKRIEDHLTSLEQTAKEGRHDVEQAELELDRAWAFVRTASISEDERRRDESVLARARELATQARAGIEQPQPDWFKVATLSARVLDLARGFQPSPAPKRDEQTAAPTDLAGAKDRAEAALGEAIALDGSGRADGTPRVLLEIAQEAYKKGNQLEATLPSADDPTATAKAAVEAYEAAEEAAHTAREHALGLSTTEGKRSGSATAAVVWGAVGAAAAGLLSD